MINFTIIIPIYNNSGTLLELHKRLEKILAGKTFEIIFVNDASPDDSAGKLLSLADSYQNINLITHKKNLGQVSALLSGLKQAQGERIIFMDADLQDEPENISLLINKFNETSDVIFAAKLNSYQSLTRMYFSLLYRKILYCLIKLPPGAGTFLIMNQNAREHLLKFPNDIPSIPVMLTCSKLKLNSIVIERKSRRQGKSSYTTTKRLLLGIKIIVAAFKWRLFKHDY